jgi:hypothetical protein
LILFSLIVSGIVLWPRLRWTLPLVIGVTTADPDNERPYTARAIAELIAHALQGLVLGRHFGETLHLDGLERWPGRWTGLAGHRTMFPCGITRPRFAMGAISSRW